MSNHRFLILDEDTKVDNEHGRSFELEINDSYPLVFRRQLTNAYIEVKGKVVLGTPGSTFELSNTEIVCDCLEIQANTIVIRNYRNDENTSIEAGRYIQDEMRTIVIDCNNPKRFSISWPSGLKYPWSEFYREQPQQLPQNLREAMLALRRILSFFRRDKKDDFARHKPLIDNMAIGNSRMRRAMHDYLLARGILTETDALYYLSIASLEEVGINWMSMRQGKLDLGLQKFLEEFLGWKDSN